MTNVATSPARIHPWWLTGPYYELAKSRASGSLSPKLDNVDDKAIILAAYTCRACDIEGRDPEVSAGTVLCWNCGEPAVITARVSG